MKTMPAQSTLQQHGFSLLEVLVAFVILVLSLNVFTQIFSRGVQTTSTGRTAIQAVILAESLMASAVQKLDGRHTTEGTSNHFDWRITATPYQSSRTGGLSYGRDDIELRRVVIEVEWHVHEEKRRLKLVSLKPVLD